MNRIGVREQQPFSPRLFRTGYQGVVLANPARRQRRRFHYSHSRKRLRDLTSAISRSVINNYYFKLHASLGRQRFQTSAKASFFVTRRHDYRHRRLLRYWISCRHSLN
jgi:hypothetical protein